MAAHPAADFFHCFPQRVLLLPASCVAQGQMLLGGCRGTTLCGWDKGLPPFLDVLVQRMSFLSFSGELPWQWLLPFFLRVVSFGIANFFAPFYGYLFQLISLAVKNHACQSMTCKSRRATLLSFRWFILQNYTLILICALLLEHFF